MCHQLLVGFGGSSLVSTGRWSLAPSVSFCVSFARVFFAVVAWCWIGVTDYEGAFALGGCFEHFTKVVEGVVY